MKDRWGRTIIVGWPEHHLLWLAAAWSLPNEDRKQALQEISDLTGRTYAAVYFRARVLSVSVERAWTRSNLIALSAAYNAIVKLDVDGAAP